MKCCLLLASWFFFPIGMLLFMFLFVCYASVFFFIKERCNYLSSLMPIFRRLCVVVQSHTLMIFFLSFILDSSIFFLVCKSTGAFSEEEGEAGWVALRLRLLLVAELGPAYRTCYTQLSTCIYFIVCAKIWHWEGQEDNAICLYCLIYYRRENTF